MICLYVLSSSQGLYDWNDNNGAATELKARIADIDIVGSVASVRLELDNWTGNKFTDLFNLLKVDGEWKIMNKVFLSACLARHDSMKSME